MKFLNVLLLICGMMLMVRLGWLLENSDFVLLCIVLICWMVLLRWISCEFLRNDSVDGGKIGMLLSWNVMNCVLLFEG